MVRDSANQLNMLNLMMRRRVQPREQMDSYNDTGIPGKLAYGGGTVTGSIGLAPIQFAGFDIPEQGSLELFRPPRECD